jgi:hypothetical protein
MPITKLIKSGSLFALLSVLALPLSATADTPMVRTKPVIDHMAIQQAKHAHQHAVAPRHRRASAVHSTTKARQLPPHS